LSGAKHYFLKDSAVEGRFKMGQENIRVNTLFGELMIKIYREQPVVLKMEIGS
jgi:hypothetical protein